jgi:hypothetical protein
MLSPTSRSKQFMSQNIESLLNIKETEVIIGLQFLDKIAEENAFTDYKICT